MSEQARAIPTPGGGHDIVSNEYGQWGASGPPVLVRVRPTGTIEWGDLPMFAPGWVPSVSAALELAQKIADRDDPAAPYTEP